MEISMTREKLRFAERVLRETRAAEETAEVIVPDALPDILRIVGADAELTVRSKDTADGRVLVSGAAAVSVIYIPDGGGGARRVNAELPFTVSAENPRITPECRVTARVEPRSVSASALNPRKLSVRAAVFAEISCYLDTELEIPAGVSPGNENIAELLYFEDEVNLPVDILEKTFTVNDEYQIPASQPPVGELLKSNVALAPGDARVVGSKLIFKGAAYVSLLYAPPDGSDIVPCAFETEFSQILELENAGADSEFELIPLLTSARIDAGNTPGAETRRVAAEIRVAAQCVARSKRTIRFIRDAYCSKYALETSVTPLSFENSLGSRAVNAILRGTLPAPDASRVICVSARPGAPLPRESAARILSVSAVEPRSTSARENDSLSLACPVEVEALYIASDGSARRAEGSLELGASVPGVGAGSLGSVRAECSRDVYGVAADNSIELRIPVDIRVDETEKREYNAISALSADEDSPVDLAALPSLVISRVSAGDSLWSLAKRHRSTRELILSANGLEPDAAPPGGSMLVIPKKR
ncbi:MAG: DUF3794 domain-containing protein [Oscillospiraceae bacterium]|jgi:hypothetical protein|nr:DUF3794 domain-containing protein [Oscillospiraceae bacterium]